MKDFDEKYIELLLKKCINYNSGKTLFISYDEEFQEFVDKLVSKIDEMGGEDIYLYNEYVKKKHDVLKECSKDEVRDNSLFDRSVWDEYAKLGASFLMLKTEYPGLMDDIDPDVLEESKNTEQSTSKEYQKLQMSGDVDWCIAIMPSKKWADKVFPDSKDSYEELKKYIYNFCMLDKEDPINNWNKLIDDLNKKIDKLNKLKIKKLNFKNDLGTDLTVSFDDDTVWNCGSVDGSTIQNMPTYEVFTTPDYKKTEGIVYNSKPLTYNGVVIDKFFLEFESGKVVNYGAEVGEDVLKELLETDDASSYLGEVALIDYDSPISNTGIIFYSTIIDENASCHIALGRGFDTCRDLDKDNLSESELKNEGVNISNNHIDFMIGTKDLEITAELDSGTKKIFEKGNFCL